VVATVQHASNHSPLTRKLFLDEPLKGETREKEEEEEEEEEKVRKRGPFAVS
jgi:hypothetical protein